MRALRTPVTMAVLGLLRERPRHPYEMRALLRERHIGAVGEAARRLALRRDRPAGDSRPDRAGGDRPGRRASGADGLRADGRPAVRCSTRSSGSTSARSPTEFPVFVAGLAHILHVVQPLRRAALLRRRRRGLRAALDGDRRRRSRAARDGRTAAGRAAGDASTPRRCAAPSSPGWTRSYATSTAAICRGSTRRDRAMERHRDDDLPTALAADREPADHRAAAGRPAAGHRSTCSPCAAAAPGSRVRRRCRR